MAFQATDGKKFTNRPPMMQHNRSMASKSGGGLMNRSDPLQQPGQDGHDEPDENDMPHRTDHHPDGSHTTHHESGKAHDSENLDALKGHLDKFFTEEQHEPAEGDEPEYE